MKTMSERWKIILYLLLSLQYKEIRSQDGFQPHIVGGQDAVIGLTPYQVSLRNFENKHFCGGSIINERWIVTAAHCLINAPLHHVVVGTIRLDSGGTEYYVQKEMPHSKYSSDTLENDIGLIKTKTNIEFNDFVKSIRLPYVKSIPDKSKMLASGWGLTSNPGTIPNILQVLNTTAISNGQCMQSLNTSRIRDTNLCVFTKQNEGLCMGDSGGPVVYNDELHGIVSYGRPCATGVPDVLTRVSKYKFWIRKKIFMDSLNLNKKNP